VRPMTADAWNPSQYDRFKRERSQPFFDLLALVRPKAGMRVVDLGCGTGALTRALHDQLKPAETLGIDSSDAMLGKAREHVAPGLRFEKGGIAEIAEAWGRLPAPRLDLVFSNAALHWVSGHEAILAKLTRGLAPGGQLAVQIPANDTHPAHAVAHALATEPPFRDALGGYTGRASVHAPEEYATWLHRLGFAEEHVRLQVYGHKLPGREDVVEWVKGTLLTDYEKRLPAPLFADFVAAYRTRLLPVLEDTHPHFYPFKRILFWGALP
jgi:trans-aconitate 2-methyltransferase